MPRPNPIRSIGSERVLARRILHERESRGWSYDALARRMTRAGCPIQASAIYKTERADSPRRIVVDELLAYARVFETPVEQMLLPPEAGDDEVVNALLLAWETARNATERAAADEEEAADRLHARLLERPGVAERFEADPRGWVDRLPLGDPDAAVAAVLTMLTGQPEGVQHGGEPQ